MAGKPKLIEITPDGSADITSANQGVKDRLTDVEKQTKAIYWVGVISLVSVILASFALVVDQMHFNNQTYRDQSSANDLRYQEATKQMELLDKKIDALTSTKTETTIDGKQTE